jgi:aspartate/methionine/tyrosine aminotransferase
MPSVTRQFSQSARLAVTQAPVIPIVAELIRRHPGTISLGQGVVYYGPPAEPVRARLDAFFREPDNHKYQAVHGIPPLVEALESKWRREHGVEVDPSRRRVVVTAGGNMAFVNAILAVADVGDEVILQSPYYFNHEMAVTIAGCRPVLAPTDDAYQLRPDAIRSAITPRTRAVVTISPNNPTGAVYPESSLRAVNAICRDAGIYHVHDEAYEYFTWNAARHFSPSSIANAEDHTICLHSLSKSYGFASWRIGSMLIPAHLFEAVRKIQDTVLICAPVVSQHAALGALDAGPEYCAKHRAAIGEVRAVVLEQLASLGDLAQIAPADGAFYTFIRVHLGARMTSMQLVETLIRDYGVAVIPGSTFGVDNAQGCVVRASYGSPQRQSVVEGIGRLVRGLRAIAGK